MEMTAPSIRVRAGTACKIANINRDRFNEAVHAGTYPCAPATAPGATRLFDLDDLTVLFFYGRLLHEDVSAKRAGELACRILSEIRQHPTETHVHAATALNGQTWWAPGATVDMNATHIAGAGPIVSIRTFHVANARAILLREIEEERNKIGED